MARAAWAPALRARLGAGIPRGPYIAGVWLAVEVVLMGAVALVGWRAARRAAGATAKER